MAVYLLAPVWMLSPWVLGITVLVTMGILAVLLVTSGANGPDPELRG